MPTSPPSDRTTHTTTPPPQALSSFQHLDLHTRRHSHVASPLIGDTHNARPDQSRPAREAPCPQDAGAAEFKPPFTKAPGPPNSSFSCSQSPPSNGTVKQKHSFISRFSCTRDIVLLGGKTKPQSATNKLAPKQQSKLPPTMEGPLALPAPAYCALLKTVPQSQGPKAPSTTTSTISKVTSALKMRVRRDPWKIFDVTFSFDAPSSRKNRHLPVSPRTSVWDVPLDLPALDSVKRKRVNSSDSACSLSKTQSKSKSKKGHLSPVQTAQRDSVCSGELASSPTRTVACPLLPDPHPGQLVDFSRPTYTLSSTPPFPISGESDIPMTAFPALGTESNVFSLSHILPLDKSRFVRRKTVPPRSSPSVLQKREEQRRAWTARYEARERATETRTSDDFHTLRRLSQEGTIAMQAAVQQGQTCACPDVCSCPPRTLKTDEEISVLELSAPEQMFLPPLADTYPFPMPPQTLPTPAALSSYPSPPATPRHQQSTSSSAPDCAQAFLTHVRASQERRRSQLSCQMSITGEKEKEKGEDKMQEDGNAAQKYRYSVFTDETERGWLGDEGMPL